MHLYLHIPFCKQACHYCNFHFSTSLGQKDALLEALLHELDLQSDYLGEAELTTVYFGGGTPSLLEIKDLARIFSKIQAIHRVDPGAEITIEANPDDLSADYLRDLRHHTPVNRLSIGVQSFQEADLRWMNRGHNAAQARDSLLTARAAGFDNITLDLIYGAPTTSDEQWRENLRIVIEAGILHLSCYCLTVEEGTALAHFVRKGQSPPVDEERAARQFDDLLDATERAGYEHYEISNFALPGQYARHNTSYWSGEPYLGIGPSAHSFDGGSRQWNVANNARYIRALAAGEVPFEREVLSLSQRYNELVMTGLRTQWGVSLERLGALDPAFAAHFEHTAQPFLRSGQLMREGNTFCLTRAGKFLADGIAAALFW